MLREVARKADQLRGELHPQLHDRRLGIEAVLAQPLGGDAAAVEPVLALRDRVDPLQVDAEGAAGVAQRRARPVADDHGGERGAVPAVLAVDVLDDLLAALVLEVDVDVGRLVALDADEAAEQQRGALRVDLGDAEAVADDRVGGAAAALAEDLLLARPADDVGDGEEVGLVLQRGDDLELALDLRPVLLEQRRVPSAIDLAAAEAPLGAGVGELAQVRGRRLAGGDDLLRILVAQLAEREAALAGEQQGVVQPLGLVQRRQAAARAQVLLGVGFEGEAAFGHRLADARGGERVLQGLPRADVHQHVAGGDDAQRHEVGDADDALDQLVVAGAVQQLEGDRGAVLEPGLQPHRVGEDLLEALRGRRHEQGQALRQAGERGRVRHLAFDIARMREVGCPSRRGGAPP